MASAKKHRVLVAYEPIDNVEEPSAAEAVDQDRTLVDQMLALLTPMERRIMEHRLAGCSDYPELAAATGYSVKTIDNALFRCRRKISSRRWRHDRRAKVTRPAHRMKQNPPMRAATSSSERPPSIGGP
jgi:DNA-directed RNA polymerase specialized sigma24 family protein